ncbi:uncharacterized protein LOC129743727 isoform X1 [Uranotaenia lowii]|uniref:uncharacterized protein LOC129743727 isoform X1 n=1 Tax=Uranotaenia lowii TaxID=190385 RepID=UPI002478C081|nr:uncharacterized protein LOC129743727 isoform X1 [Uranotaenia lowii]
MEVAIKEEPALEIDNFVVNQSTRSNDFSNLGECSTSYASNLYDDPVQEMQRLLAEWDLEILTDRFSTHLIDASVLDYIVDVDIIDLCKDLPIRYRLVLRHKLKEKRMKSPQDENCDPNVFHESPPPKRKKAIPRVVIENERSHIRPAGTEHTATSESRKSATVPSAQSTPLVVIPGPSPAPSKPVEVRPDVNPVPEKKDPPTINSCCSCGKTKERELMTMESVERHEWTAKSLIQRSVKGTKILKQYERTNMLTRADRAIITSLIVDDLSQQHGKLTKMELVGFAAELKSLFPTVDEHVWYRPSIIVDHKTGKKIKLGRLAGGCLFDRNNKQAPVLKSVTKSTPKKRDNSPSFSEQVLQEEAIQSYQETKEWFRNHQDEWDEVQSRWRSTSEIRIHEITQSDERTFSKILTDYPILRGYYGYELVKIDFEHQYPEKVDLLFTRFDDFRQRLKPLLHKHIGNQGKALLKLLDEDLPEDVLNCETVTLLSHLWPSSILKPANKYIWKPSIKESCEGIIIRLETLADYEAKISSVHEQRAKRGLPDTPVILAVGETPKSTHTFFVSFDFLYQTDTFLEALDIVFKIHKSYDLKFPVEAQGTWSFISCFFYDFELGLDRNKANILYWCKMLQNKNS